jgi:hypothetical protein
MIPEIRISSVEYMIQLKGLSGVQSDTLEKQLSLLDWITNTSVENGVLYIEVGISSGTIEEIQERHDDIAIFFKGYL